MNSSGDLKQNQKQSSPGGVGQPSLAGSPVKPAALQDKPVNEQVGGQPSFVKATEGQATQRTQVQSSSQPTQTQTPVQQPAQDVKGASASQARQISDQPTQSQQAQQSVIGPSGGVAPVSQPQVAHTQPDVQQPQQAATQIIQQEQTDSSQVKKLQQMVDLQEKVEEAKSQSRQSFDVAQDKQAQVAAAQATSQQPAGQGTIQHPAGQDSGQVSLTQQAGQSQDQAQLQQLGQVQDQQVVEPSERPEPQVGRPVAAKEAEFVGGGGLKVSEQVPVVEVREFGELPTEVEGWVERVEQDNVEDVKPVVHEGKTIVSPVIPQNVKVTLPLDQSAIQKGLHYKVIDSFRWLAEWCKRLVEKYKGQVGYKN